MLMCIVNSHQNLNQAASPTTNVVTRKSAGTETALILVLLQILAALMPFAKSEGTELDVHALPVQREIHFQIAMQLNPAQSVDLIRSVPRTRPV